jgi:uncharacterized protein
MLRPEMGIDPCQCNILIVALILIESAVKFLSGMNIEHDKNRDSGQFFIRQEKDRIAELAYSLPEKYKMDINHTEVPGTMEGKGIGKLLVAAAVSYARENKLKVVAVCAFANLIINLEKDFQDVL